jgi:hypothetical protein
MVEDNQFTPLSSSTLMLKGKKHRQGGTDIAYNGQIVEAESGEPVFTDDEGALIVAGNMTNPLTNRKFKSDVKIIGEKEAKMDTLMSKGTGLINNSDPYDQWDVLKFNAGRVMATGAYKKKKELEQSKNHLADIQQAMLDRADELGVDPDSFSKGYLRKAKNGVTIKAQPGKTIPPKNEWEAYIEQEAERQGVNPEIARRMIYQESKFKHNALSERGAEGIMQFMPATARKYGVEDILRSSKPEDMKKVINAGIKHFKSALVKNNYDYTLALAEYNGGDKALRYARRGLGKKNITGSDFMKFLENERETNPSSDKHAYKNETYTYINNIMHGDKNFSNKADLFRGHVYGNSDPSDNPIDNSDPTVLHPVTVTSVGRLKTPNVGETTPQPFRRVSRGRDYGFNYNEEPQEILPSNTENLNFLQVMPELYAAATNRPEPVFAQTYSPDLYQPYNISLQDRRNVNNQTFREVTQRLTDNPEALSTLAAQKYAADNQVNAEEFRINQGIQNDITNKNIQLLNDAELKNLAIADTQYTRQSTAKSKTKAVNQAILNSISGKLLQNNLENRQIQVQENLYPDYRYDGNYNLQKVGDSGFNQLNFGNSTNSSPLDQNSSLRINRDKNGNITTTSETIPSLVDSNLKNIKYRRSVMQQLNDTNLLFDPKTKSLRARNYSPLKGYDYSR